MKRLIFIFLFSLISGQLWSQVIQGDEAKIFENSLKERELNYQKQKEISLAVKESLKKRTNYKELASTPILDQVLMEKIKNRRNHYQIAGGIGLLFGFAFIVLAFYLDNRKNKKIILLKSHRLSDLIEKQSKNSAVEVLKIKKSYLDKHTKNLDHKNQNFLDL